MQGYECMNVHVHVRVLLCAPPMDNFLPCTVLLLIFDQNICGIIVTT